MDTKRHKLGGGFAWRCQQCGHTFNNAQSTERAILKGCPTCTSKNIDFTRQLRRPGDLTAEALQLSAAEQADELRALGKQIDEPDVWAEPSPSIGLRLIKGGRS